MISSFFSESHYLCFSFNLDGLTSDFFCSAFSYRNGLSRSLITEVSKHQQEIEDKVINEVTY